MMKAMILLSVVFFAALGLFGVATEFLFAGQVLLFAVLVLLCGVLFKALHTTMTDRSLVDRS